MAISSFSELKTAVANWINRDDLTDRIPEFIALAEGMFNRRLRHPRMENSATAVLSGETLAFPTDFLSLRSMFIDGNPDTELDFVPYSSLRTLYPTTATGIPQVYTEADGAFYFAPVPSGDYTVHMVYWQQIPALSDSQTTNWLLTAHPDLYLYASLIHAAKYIRDDAEMAGNTVLAERYLAELAKEGTKRAAGGSPLAIRPRKATWATGNGRGVW